MDIEKAMKHNLFGGVCLKSHMRDKAIFHLKKALELSEGVAFSNAHVNLANAYAEIKDVEQAKFHFQEAIKVSPYNNSSNVSELESKLNSQEALSEAYSNLAVYMMNEENLEEARTLLNRSIELKADSAAHINMANLLRQEGRKEEAIEYAWSKIAEFDATFPGQVPLDASTFEVPEADNLHVVCVKWGSKYGADYVNKLFHGVKRHLTSQDFTFTCFTENPEGLEEGIAVEQLAEDWSGWWGKATLFSETGLEGRLLYIDLDTVITGSLNELAAYRGPFAVMGTSDIYCEKGKDGYNTSIIAWHSSFGKQLYTTLKAHYSTVMKFICRFDHWTEMNVRNADTVQQLFPGQFLDYMTYCVQSVPEDCRMVCFPRDPKPHDCNSEWVEEYWL